MPRWIRTQWFLVGLSLIIPGGLLLGYGIEEAAQRFADAIPSRWVTAAILFLMAFSLDSRKFRDSMKSPAPVLWAAGTNYVLLPLLGLAMLPLQLSEDFRVGLFLAVSMPCTMAAASVWTRRAGGNDAVSLLVTLTTNAACFAVTPLWLMAVSDDTVVLDFRDMILRLFQAVLVPILAGQALRLLKPAAAFANDNKPAIGVIAQGLILVLVFAAACRAGVSLATQSHAPGLPALLVMAICCFAAHIVAMAIAWRGAKLFGFSREDAIACAFAGSQKTLPIGVLLAAQAFASFPFAVFPILVFHAIQLFFDTAVADRMKLNHAPQAEGEYE